MARVNKSSVLVYLALLCQVAMGSPSNRDTYSSSSVEGLKSEEGHAAHDNGRGRTDIFFGDRAAQREMAERFAPVITNPVQSHMNFDHKTQMAMQRGAGHFLPLPEEPSFLADPSQAAMSVVSAVRSVAEVIHRIPEAVGAFGSSKAAVISESVQRVLNSPVTVFNGQTSVISSDKVVYPTGPSFSAQNSFPIVVVQPNQSGGNSHPVNFSPQSNDNDGLFIPVAFGGVEPPSDYVPQDQLFFIDEIDGGSFNGGGPPNLFPSQTTHTNFGTTGSASSGGSPNTFLPQNLNTNFGLAEPAFSGGSPNVFPSQDANTNFGSSTGLFNFGSFQQPSTVSLGSPAYGFPTNNNFLIGAGSTSQFPSQNTDQLGGGISYPDTSTVVNGIQVFTLDLLDTFKSVSHDNVVYSPVSIASLLSLLTLATKGNSQHEIEVALFPLTSLNSNDQHSQYAKTLERLNRLSPGITISTSSKLFLEQSVAIFGSFSDGAKKYYNCNVSLENFSRKPEQTMKRVNNWVEKETRGKISQFISEPFSPNTMFVAANTIYFDGEWATPFPEYFTAEKDFDTGHETIQIPMMINVFETPHYYSKEFNVDVASLPYRGGEFAMIIILPRESAREKSIIDLEKQLDSTTIENLVHNLTSKSVSISLPKMKLVMKSSLVENLSELRIQSIFSPSTADFGSLSDKKPLWVSQFLHEAVMEVTEVGTVAAGVSAASLDRIGGYQRINVNKPAIIFIRDMVTGVPLFWTRLVKPERVPESGQKKASSSTKF